MSSQYTQKLPTMLAAQTDEGDNESNTAAPFPDQQEEQVIHVYPVAGGGLLFSPTELDHEESQATIIDSEEPPPQPQAQKPKQRESLSVLHGVLIVLLFLLLDSASTMLTALMTPTAIITVIPHVQSITLQSSIQVGKLLAPITLSESQTVPTTGHGHQNAASATGSLTVYNGLFTTQFIAQGTVFTGSDGVSIVTTQPAYIPAGNPTTGYGEVTVTAQAVQQGKAGNIAAGAIDTTINNGLLVKNSQFSGGQDERNFQVVTQTDRDTAAAALQAKVSASMTVALQQQLTAAEQVQHLPCTPTITTDHPLGSEAAQLHVTVFATCTAIAYNTKELTTQATRLLATQAVKTVGTGYALSGNIHVTVTKATVHHQTGMLSFRAQGSYVYQLTENWQHQMKTLLAGKPRSLALRVLATLPGIRQVSISGIPDNQQLPDPDHIQLLIVLVVS